jgi:hypothetical protein
MRPSIGAGGRSTRITLEAPLRFLLSRSSCALVGGNKMRTGYVVGGQIKPGRNDEAIALAQEAMKLFERLGADEVAFRLGGGGTASGSTSFKFEAPSQGEMGALLDRMMGDSDYQSFMTRISADNAPSVLGELLGFNVLDVGLPAGTPGHVGMLVAWQPKPGRGEDAIALAIDSAKVLLRLGASRSRIVQVSTGQNIPGFVSATESVSFTAQGRWRDALETDDEWQAILTRLVGADAPGTFRRLTEWFSPI